MILGELYSLRGTARLARFRLRHHRPSLDRAIGDLERSAARLRPAHADRPLVLAALSNGLIWRYQLTSHDPDLDGAIDRLREAIASPSVGTTERAAFGADLAAALQIRYLRDGGTADVDEAINAATSAIEHGAEVDGAVTNRALALVARYEQTAYLADLLAALQDARTPVRGPLRARLHRTTRLGALIDALGSRYQFTGDQADAAAAVAAGEEALAALARDDPNRSLFAARLSEILRLSDEESLRSDAVTWAEEAVRSGSESHVDHAYVLSALSTALFARHAYTGDRTDLRRAWETASEALARSRGRNRPVLLQRVGLVARRWFDVSGDRAVLDQGEGAIREALDTTGPDHPMREALVCELDELRCRRPDDRDRALEILGLLSATVRAQPGVRSIRFALKAATRLGELGVELGDVDGAMAGYRRAVELLPVAAWPGLRRAVREARLADAPRATDAAAQAVRTGDPSAAVELLEAGRTVLWSQQLGMRTDLDRLRDVAPEAADRLDAIRGWFERPGDDGTQL